MSGLIRVLFLPMRSNEPPCQLAVLFLHLPSFVQVFCYIGLGNVWSVKCDMTFDRSRTSRDLEYVKGSYSVINKWPRSRRGTRGVVGCMQLSQRYDALVVLRLFIQHTRSSACDHRFGPAGATPWPCVYLPFNDASGLPHMLRNRLRLSVCPVGAA